MHGNTYNHTLPHANRVESQPTVGYGGSHSKSIHPMPYDESLDTEYESECSETNYPVDIVNKRDNDFLTSDSESVSSVMSDEFVRMDYIYRKGRQILNEVEDNFNKFKSLRSV